MVYHPAKHDLVSEPLFFLSIAAIRSYVELWLQLSERIALLSGEYADRAAATAQAPYGRCATSVVCYF